MSVLSFVEQVCLDENLMKHPFLGQLREERGMESSLTTETSFCQILLCYYYSLYDETLLLMMTMMMMN